MTREWDSDAYHRLSDHQFAWGVKVLARAPIRGDETVLDAGCGTGRLTGELLRRLPHGRVVALDLSENMVRTARSHLEPDFPGISFVRADVQALPFSETFEGIFSTATFHWAKDHARLFQSLLQALKPGGWLEAQCGGGPNLARLLAHAAAVMAQPAFAEFFAGWPGPWEYADAPTTAARLRQAGFVNVETTVEGAEFRIEDPEEYQQYLATVIFHRHLARIDGPGLRAQFVQELAAPHLELDYWRLNLRGMKPCA